MSQSYGNVTHAWQSQCNRGFIHSSRTIHSTWNSALKVKTMYQTMSASQPLPGRLLHRTFSSSLVLRLSPLLRPHPDADVHFVNMTALTRGGLHSSFWIVDRKHIYIGSADMDWRSLFKVTKHIKWRDGFWWKIRRAAPPLSVRALLSERSDVVGSSRSSVAHRNIK